MTPTQLHRMGLLEAAQAIRQGDLSSEELTRALLERIARHENTVQAFQWIDPARALDLARQADRRLRSKATVGPLHGIPIGIKDIIETQGIPTTHGLAHLRWLRARPLGGAGPACRGRGRLRAGQDRHHGVCLLHPREDPQSVERGPHAGRIVQRLGGGGGHGVSAGGGRHPDQRFDDPARGLLRRRGVQADSGPHLPRRRPPLQPQPRSAGRVRPQRTRCRPSGSSSRGQGRRCEPATGAEKKVASPSEVAPMVRAPALAAVRSPVWHLADPHAQEHFLEMVARLRPPERRSKNRSCRRRSKAPTPCIGPSCTARGRGSSRSCSAASATGSARVSTPSSTRVCGISGLRPGPGLGATKAAGKGTGRLPECL